MIYLISSFLVLAFTTANADYIDFTDYDEYYSLIHLKNSAETEIQVDDNIVNMTLTAYPDNVRRQAKMTWNENDGIGIRKRYEYDEIEADEILRIEFDEDLLLSEVNLSDFFYENGYVETGSFSLSDGSTISFEAVNPSHPNGEQVIDVNKTVSWIEFSAPGRVNGENHEYSVAGLTLFSSVPEPATWILLGFSLVTVFGWRKLHISD